MSNLKKFGVVLAAVFALTAIAASSASAQLFTAAAGGVAISGSNNFSSVNSQQVFNDNNGGNLNAIKCNEANVTGNTAGTSSHSQKVNVKYTSASGSKCAAFLGNATIDGAEYEFTLANSNTDMNLDTGNVDILNPITITTSLGCNVVVGVQTVGTVTFETDNNSNSNNTITATAAVTGINSTGNGGACSSNNTSGTYNGMTEVFSNSNLSFDITG